MQVEAVVFDMDGLMLDTESLYKAAWQRAASELGYGLEDESYTKLVGRPNDDCERVLVTLFGSEFPLAVFRSRWPELWRAHVAEFGIRTKPGLIECLNFIEHHALRVAVATSSDVDYTRFSLRQAGLDGRFATIVTGDQIARGKPAPDIYLEAARRLGVEASRCVALEDSEAGILAASGAGMIAVMVPDWIPPSAAAAGAAFRVLGSLNEACELLTMLVAREPGAPPR